MYRVSQIESMWLRGGEAAVRLLLVFCLREKFLHSQKSFKVQLKISEKCSEKAGEQSRSLPPSETET